MALSPMSNLTRRLAAEGCSSPRLFGISGWVWCVSAALAIACLLAEAAQGNLLP